MSEYTREMIGNCRRWIKDLTDDSVNETLCADEFAGLLDDALDEIERQQARIAELEAENAGLKERVAMLDVTAVYKSLGEMGYIEQTNRLHTSIAESESTIEQLIEAGKGLLDSLCTDPEEEKTVEVMNWKAVVDKVNKERER